MKLMSAMFHDQRRAIAIAAPARGFSIVSAIFLLVVLATLGTLMLTFATSQHAGSAQDIQGSRAYQAAKSGIEWGLYQLLQGSQCAASATLTPGGTLSGFSVVVTCSTTNNPTPFTESGVSHNIYKITSTATLSSNPDVGSPDYVERSITVTAEH